MDIESSPLVSVVIPSYNHGRFLGRALQSVIDQTYTNWEVIIVDNRSTDNTDEVLAGFLDSRLVHLKTDNKGVIAKSRNVGIRVARGEWIAFLDSDDWWNTDKLKRAIVAAGEGFDVVYHGLEIVGGASGLFKKKIIYNRQVKSPVLVDLLMKRNALATSSVMIRKEILLRVDGMNESPEMVAAEDYNTWLKCSRVTEKFFCISECLGYYSVHDQSVSKKKDMSNPLTKAVEEFLVFLNSFQKLKVRLWLSYVFIRHRYRLYFARIIDLITY